MELGISYIWLANGIPEDVGYLCSQMGTSYSGWLVVFLRTLATCTRNGFLSTWGAGMLKNKQTKKQLNPWQLSCVR